MAHWLKIGPVPGCLDDNPREKSPRGNSVDFSSADRSLSSQSTGATAWNGVRVARVSATSTLKYKTKLLATTRASEMISSR